MAVGGFLVEWLVFFIVSHRPLGYKIYKIIQDYSINMAAIHEGPEYGIGDFVLLESVDIGSFMKNLKHRFVKILIFVVLNKFFFFLNLLTKDYSSMYILL